MRDRYAAAPERSLPRRDWIVLFVALTLALLPGFFSTPVMDRDEARYSQASSQMIETGDYVDIRFQDQPRHVKPVGIYWMQAASAHVFGGAEAPIWAFRIPSALGILLGAAATAWLGGRMFGRRVGLGAGLLLGLSLMAAVEGRTAKTDAMLMGMAAIAQAALFVILVGHRRREKPAFVGAPLIFWAATGGALLIKGPIVAMVSALTVLGYVLVTRERAALWRLRPLMGVGVAALVFLPWFIAIMVQTNGAYFMESVGHALLGKVAESDDSHAGPFGYHTMLLPVMFWPGSVLLGLAGLAAWRWRKTAKGLFLLAWILPSWLVFELVHTKLPHYIFPMMPAIAILAAYGAVHAARLLKGGRQRALHYGAMALFALVALILGAAPIIFAKVAEADLTPSLNAVAVAAGVLAAGLGVWFALRRTERAAGLFAGGVIALYLAVFEVNLPQLDAMWPSSQLNKLVNASVACEPTTVAIAGYPEPSNVFYFGTQTRLTDGAGAAAALADGGACAVAIVEARYAEAFNQAAGQLSRSFEQIGAVEGYNTVKGRPMTLSVYLATD